jgi:hypothetical protein
MRASEITRQKRETIIYTRTPGEVQTHDSNVLAVTYREKYSQLRVTLKVGKVKC